MTHSGVRSVSGDSIEVFTGAASTTSAYIYVRWPAAEGGKRYRISGMVSGPYCQFSSTLIARLPLVDQGAGPTVLARAAVTDPCPWSPELPAWYLVEAILHEEDREVARTQRPIGIRSIGVHGRHVFHQSTRTVLRGWQTHSAPALDDPSWRELSLCSAITDPTDAQCESATQSGVIVVAHIAAEHDATEQLRRLARWAAVSIVTCTDQQLLTLESAAIPGRPLVAQRVTAGDDPVAPLAQLVWLTVEDRAASIELVRRLHVPVIACQAAVVDSIAAARTACEQLQAFLAPEVDLAGYFIETPRAV